MLKYRELNIITVVKAVVKVVLFYVRNKFEYCQGHKCLYILLNSVIMTSLCVMPEL